MAGWSAGTDETVRAGARSSGGVLAWIRAAWHPYSARAAEYQSELLLTIVYYALLGPSALVARLFGTRLLDLRSDARRWSGWIRREPLPKTISWLERQF